MTGARRKTGRSASRGVTSSFWTNLTPSAMSWAQPWKAPAYIGPSRPCMCAITLCSACPTSSGRVRNATTTATTRIASSIHAGTRPPLGRVGHAGRAHRLPAAGRVLALARLLGARPRLGHAGGQDEVLAQRLPLELGREQQRGQPGGGREAGEVEAEHLVRLPLVPGGARVERGNRLDGRRFAGQPGAQEHTVLLRRRPDVD